MTTPTNGAIFTAPATITLTANASDADNGIASVAFYHSTFSSIGDAITNAPYTYAWPAPKGSFALTARVTDGAGLVRTSAVVAITIVDPVYALTVNNGSGTGSYTNGQRVAIAASNAPSEKTFDQWIGDTQHVVSVTSATTTVTMPAQAIALTATYKDFLYTLAVTSGTGGGLYTNGTTVTITASNAPAGQVFAQWTGATQYVASVTSVTTAVTMPASNIAVTAAYTDVYALTVVDGTGDGLYTNGSVVAISAEDPIIGKAFDRWTGDTQYVNNVTYTNALVTMSTNAVTLTATYVDALYTLTVASGDGGGSYTNGAKVTITASNAPAGQVFDRWIGDVQVVNNATYTNALVTMPAQAISLTATYKAIPGYYILTVSNGTGSGAYTNGEQVTITATNTPESGAVFDRWVGATQYVSSVFALNTIVTMPAQDVALTASCVDSSNGLSIVTWESGLIFYPGDTPLLTSGQSTIAQLMYSPDDTKDSILPRGVGAANDVVLDILTITQNDSVPNSEYGIFSALTERARTNGYVYALIFQDNSVQAGDWYVAGPVVELVDGAATVNTCADGSYDYMQDVNSMQVIEGSAGYTLTVNNGSGGGTYTNTQVVGVSANPPASGKIFDQWTGDTNVLSSNTVSTTVTMSTNAVSLTATYKYLPGQHTLTVSNGTGGGIYSNGTEVAIAANSPAAGKAFSRWVGDTQHVASVVSANTTVTMSTNAVSLTATYTDVPYTLTVASGSGDGSYTNGQRVDISADVIFAKTFYRWTGATQVVDSVSAANTTVTMPAQAASLTATYVGTTYPLTVNSGSGSGSYTYGSNVTITASDAPTGQAFDRWAGDTKYLANSNSASTTVTMPAGAISLTANYKIVYTLTVNGGTGGGSYVAGELRNIRANPASNGTAFAWWTGDTTNLLNTISNPTNAARIPAMDITLTATYTNLPGYYTLAVAGGSGSGSYTNGQQVAITATATSRTFVAWIGNTNALSSNTVSTTVTMPASNIAVTAIYSNVLLTVNSGAGGGTYTNQQQVAIAASNISGKAFFKWTGDTQSVASVTSATTTVTLPAQDITLTATYNTAYTLTVSNGTGSGVYTNRTRVPITASNAPSGKAFDGWTGATQYLINVTSATNAVTNMPASNITVAATYRDVYVLTVSNGTGSGSSYSNGQYVAITASNAPAGRAFDRWTGDTQYVDSVTSTNATVTMLAPNIAVAATYTDTYVLTVTDGTGSGAYIEGSQVTIAAIVPVGMDFDQWTGNTQCLASVTSATTTVTMPPEYTSVVATYKAAYYAFTVINGTIIGGTGSGFYTNGQRVAIAATVPTVPPGLTFVNWNDGNTRASRTVTMPPYPITYTANIIDLQQPTVKITYPVSKSKIMTNGTVIIRGKAADNVGVTGVMHQLYTGEWTNAVTTDGWKNWTADFYPVSGLNTARVYSVDTQGNTSETATVVFTYVPGAVMEVQIKGDGTIKPDYNGKVLQIGKSYKMTAKAAKYSSFTDWTYGIGGPVASGKSKITFVMQSNLVLTANFQSLLEARIVAADIAVAAPITPQAAITVDGSAKDWANVPRSSFSYASVTQEVAAALDGNNIALLLTGCPFEASDNVLVYFKLRLSYGSGENRHAVDLWTSGSVLYGMVDGQVITGLEAVMLDGVLEVKLPVEQAPSQVTIEEIGCGMDLGGGTLTELFKLTPPPALTQ